MALMVLVLVFLIEAFQCLQHLVWLGTLVLVVALVFLGLV